MSLSYAQLTTRALQFLQDTGAATYDATETGDWIEDELKRISQFSPYIYEVLSPIESRTGTDVTGTASSLTDLVKLQFVAGDATLEKVVHNTKDDTWAVVTGNTSTSVLTLSADIMDANETYEIYNKRCRNEKQIFLGGMPDYLWIESVEYPVGTGRKFKLITKDILELDVDDAVIQDSNPALTTLNQVDVLIRFAVPQSLCQLADLAGAVHTAGAVGDTTMQVKTFTDTQIVESGDLFNIADHKTTYIINSPVTLANQAAAGSTLSFYPGLEAVANINDVVTFVKSTLQPVHEEFLAGLVTAKAKISDAERLHILAIADMTAGRLLINTINKGGGGTSVSGEYLQYAQSGLKIAADKITTGLQEQAAIIRRLPSIARPSIGENLSRS